MQFRVTHLLLWMAVLAVAFTLRQYVRGDFLMVFVCLAILVFIDVLIPETKGEK